MAADGTTTLLLWVVLTGAVVLVALTATWFLGSMAANGLLNMATRYVASSQASSHFTAMDSLQAACSSTVPLGWWVVASGLKR